MIQVVKLAGGIVAIGVFIVIFGPIGASWDADPADAEAEVTVEEIAEVPAEDPVRPVVRTMSSSNGSAKFQSVAPRD